MATSGELRLLTVQMFGLFVFILTTFKLVLNRVNGFDALAVLVLAVSSTITYTGVYGYIAESVVFGIVVAIFAMTGGANRRGMLFLAGTLILSEVLIKYKRILGELDDLDACTPIVFGSIIQACLFASMAYNFVNEHEASDGDKNEYEKRTWLTFILLVSSLSTAFKALACTHESTSITSLYLDTFRVLVLAVACVANAEDETLENVS